MNKQENHEVITFIEKYIEICRSINETYYFPTLKLEFVAMNTNGTFIKFCNNKYIYGDYQNGERTVISLSNDFWEVMYHPIKYAVKRFAESEELEQRSEKFSDPRIFWFPLAVEYMKKIDASWSERLHEELSQYLQF